MAFQPAEEVVELDPRRYAVMCHPAGHPLFCWVGDSKTFTAYDFELRNGWTVEESWLEVKEIRHNAGAYFENQPKSGDTRAYVRITVWADGLSARNVRRVSSSKARGGRTPADPYDHLIMFAPGRNFPLAAYLSIVVTGQLFSLIFSNRRP